MYRQVYFHKTVWCAEALFQALVRRASELARRGGLDHAPAGHPIIRILQGTAMSTADYLRLDDAEMKVMMKLWMRERDPILADLCRRLVERDLYKVRIFYEPADTPPLRVLRDAAWALMREKYGAAVDYRFLFEDATDIFYQKYDPSNLGSSGILIRHRDGSIVEIDDASPSIRALKKTYPMHMWCFPAEDKDAMMALDAEGLAKAPPDEDNAAGEGASPEAAFAAGEDAAHAQAAAADGATGLLGLTD
jgi:HD superfamily phosphohydrolase